MHGSVTDVLPRTGPSITYPAHRPVSLDFNPELRCAALAGLQRVLKFEKLVAFTCHGEILVDALDHGRGAR